MSGAEDKFNVDSLAQALENANVSPGGVSFAGKSLKLDSVGDAKEIIDEINKCKNLESLNLEGNTLGVDASKGIADALAKHPELKRALWKDMFTGRMKTEIPKALQHLGDGLVKAGARLTELDLSDNAFGPIGVEGLASLLRSPTCYALQELRLNNNGLGITGGKLLASALTDCYNSSKNEGKPLALKVFVAGRNRLENEGAKALAEVFKMIGTLEEVSMPQNGIYHAGVKALSDAFAHNRNLQVLNLNDNTIGSVGAGAVAHALPRLQMLRELNFGDCLLKTAGAMLIAESLHAGHRGLEVLVLGFNEISSVGGLALADAMANKTVLRSLVLDGNQFGREGAEKLRERLADVGRSNALGSLDDNESEEEQEDEDEDDESDDEEGGVQIVELETSAATTTTVADFLREPTPSNFEGLGPDRDRALLDAIRDASGDVDLDAFVPALMKVAALDAGAKLAETMYKELFAWAQRTGNLSIVNNSLLVHLGLIKSEEKKFKVTWDVRAGLQRLKRVVPMNFVPDSTRDVLRAFLPRNTEATRGCEDLKDEILLLLRADRFQ
ncbi:ran GTPase-activating protein 1 [Cylas formicarius]|uniref:ran GTPase-activating protein 1 n=1 Tax=Cylas formicarius TaxID=197179 RepID=UPI00295897DD|nr:ran GTPase-activating protein 1 [Cylas formicarius]